MQLIMAEAINQYSAHINTTERTLTTNLPTFSILKSSYIVCLVFKLLVKFYPPFIILFKINFLKHITLKVCHVLWKLAIAFIVFLFS